jgi:hypothetical protein
MVVLLALVHGSSESERVVPAAAAVRRTCIGPFSSNSRFSLPFVA